MWITPLSGLHGYYGKIIGYGYVILLFTFRRMTFYHRLKTDMAALDDFLSSIFISTDIYKTSYRMYESMSYYSVNYPDTALWKSILNVTFFGVTHFDTINKSNLS